MRPMTRRHFVFDWQIWPLLCAGILSAALGYNTRLALFLFGLIVLGVIVYLVMANLADPFRRGLATPRSILSGILALLPLAIAAYFFLTNDWSRWIGKLSVFDPVLRVLAAWPLSSIGMSTNPNAIGGVIAALLPLQVYALRHARRGIAALLIGVSGITLAFSETRGAWLALALVTAMWLLWRFLAARQSQVRRARWMWLAVVVGACAVGIVLFTTTPLGERLLGLGGDRIQIWRNSLDLVGDYPLTGFGLGDFEMTYSTYVLLIHVGHTMHAHNLWLDVWLNLGLLGLLALVGLVVNAVWPRPSPSTWRMAALMTLGIILLHTLGDDPIFGGAAIPTIFIPLGLLARSAPATTGEVPRLRCRLQPALGIWSVAVLMLATWLVTAQGRAALESNVGALLQTRAELLVYHWPEIPLQDVLRRTDQIDLTSAIQHFQIALALDPANVTAQRRLGQIDLAREQYESACQHFEAAAAVDPFQRATQQLLGECDALRGESSQASALWRNIDLGQSQLDLRVWWYQDYLNDLKRTQQLKQAMAELNQTFR
jgi:O-antigen ligase